MSRRLVAGAAIGFLLLVAVIGFAILQPRAAPGTTADNATTPTRLPFVKGLTFSPASYDSSGISDFFSNARQAGSVVEWAGDWQQLGGGGAPAQVAQLASANGMASMIVVQFFTQSTGELIRPLNSTNEQNYLTITENFVKQYKPAYLGVGIEVNVLYEKNITNFDRFVSLYAQVYGQVKSVSPGTTVFTIFQLERMNGLNGGLYGGTNDPSKAEWQLLTLFPKTDVVAFTTYPGLVYQSPSDVPEDYYSQIATHTNRSVGFTEVGWHTGYIAGGWGSNESEQASFVATFFRLSGGIPKAFVVWSFLYDQNTTVPFNSMGLFYVNGTAKQSWQTWLGAT